MEQIMNEQIFDKATRDRVIRKLTFRCRIFTYLFILIAAYYVFLYEKPEYLWGVLYCIFALFLATMSWLYARRHIEGNFGLTSDDQRMIRAYLAE
jgi:hypothetical protein